MTNLLYLNDTYLFETEAKFIELRENEKGTAVILDQTIFYPQGGGQPADTGKIISGSNVFTVTDVRLDEQGIVWHFGTFTTNSFNKGDEVSLQIDKDKRLLNARLHSAGHLLDCAVSKLHIQSLKPTKGFHFPQGPYVEYDGVVEDNQALIPVLEKTINELIEENLHTASEDLSPEEAKTQGIWAPPGKSARVVRFRGYEHCGCGGTHINNASEIGKIQIRKIKSKKGTTRISYAI
jgi:Ser-tRNA(Ala) deacylase AlaX